MLAFTPSRASSSRTRLGPTRCFPSLKSGKLDLLAVLNDGLADGRDVSWIWDADLEVIVPRVRRAMCNGGRATELALQLKYVGLRARFGSPWSRRRGAALDCAVAEGEAGRPLYALTTYSPLLTLRGLLAECPLARR